MRIIGSALALACAMCMLAPARGADGERGKALYEARCNLCHATSVHARAARKAASFEGLRAQVARWSAEIGAGWSADEINDVTAYLNDRYYSFPCPPTACPGARAGSESGRNLAHSRARGQ